MPSNDSHEAHDYAERIREKLPRKLQELREAAELSKYVLDRESDISSEYIGGDPLPANPSTNSNKAARPSGYSFF